PSTIRIQHHQPYRPCGGRGEGLLSSWSPERNYRKTPARPALAACGGAEVRPRTGKASVGGRMDRCSARSYSTFGKRKPRTARAKWWLVSVRPHSTGCLCNRTVAVRPAHCRRRCDG